MRDVPEESLMLTGDENIVDVDVSVFWLVKTGGAGDYLFNIQNPEGTVKAVAESAMREVIGRSEIQPILTGARQAIETAVHELMQKVLDTYQAGIQVTQVQMQKVDPPAQVIDAFRDVQAARADLERAQNEAQTYANRVVPEARGTRRADPAVGRSLSRADRRRSQGSGSALQSGLRAIQEGAGGHAPAHLSGDDGARVRRHRQDPSRFQTSRATTPATSCRSCRSMKCSGERRKTGGTR